MGSTEALRTSSPKAFLRWAGGKTWLVRRLKDLFGNLTFNRYHEPFLGGGSVFFALAPGKEAYLSDKNEALIELYASIRDNPGEVIKYLKKYENTEAAYYLARHKFHSDRFARAAQFIYLNQTSFNGIYRVNLKGIYNVPYGHRTKNFLDEDSILSASNALQNVNFSVGDFEESLDKISKQDLVFIDPPYTVSHNNNGFIKYNKHLFSLEDQFRLANFIREIRKRDAKYILTNAAHKTIEDIFSMGDQMVRVNRASLIGGKQAPRGPVSEYIFTNLPVGTAWES